MTSPPAGRADPLLVALVAHCRERGGGWPVTLLVGGVLVSGQMVSEEVWHAEMVRIFERAPAQGEVVQEVAAQFRDLRAQALLAEAAGPAGDPELIHLLDAVVAAGETRVVGRWRIQVDAVDGWQIGRALKVERGQPEAVREV